jgi:hypothetical protein
MATFLKHPSFAGEVCCKYPRWLTLAMAAHKRRMRDLQEKERLAAVKGKVKKDL